jgi:hypothetical protein
MKQEREKQERINSKTLDTLKAKDTIIESLNQRILQFSQTSKVLEAKV